MSYRKLTINGINYEFVIGKTFTKVKKGGKAYTIFENEKIGSPHMQRSCMGTFYTSGQFVITPLNVRNALLGENIPTNICKNHNVTTTGMHADPYEKEIYGRTVYVTNCPICYEKRAEDI